MRRRMLSEFWFYFSENKGAVIGLWVFVVLVVMALAAPLIAPHEPYQQYRDAFLLAAGMAGRWKLVLYSGDGCGRA